MQAYSTAQENTGKLTENAISQAVTRAQNTTTSSRNFRVTVQTHHMTSNLAMSKQPDIDTHQTHRAYAAHIPPHTCTKQQHLNETSINFNESIIELLMHQTELTYSTQHLHQQTTEALNNIIKSSSL